ncbi:hypothetical protein CHS0354_010815 [Potamilus streckersoni]|uniref:Grh/CP2 DB domain-containing protein n=1 Tax=Potamilus streckersoni TaxID=2493646 RepID=A0AAE0T951_9BIVA|nr:hypothetical protein CHS0354_010815 [Potamilus streckersoni]
MLDYISEDLFLLLDHLESGEPLKHDSKEDTRKDGNNKTSEGPPDDIRAFFGHPLTAATTAINGEDTNASAVALLHEYINLPALDKSGMKIGDKFHSIYDIMRDEDHKNNIASIVEASEEYMVELNGEVDKFFNREEANGSETSSDPSPAKASEQEVYVHPVASSKKPISPPTPCYEVNAIYSSKSSISDVQTDVQADVQASSSTTIPILNPLAKCAMVTPTTDCPKTRCENGQYIVDNVSTADNKIMCRSEKDKNAKADGEKTQDISRKLIKALTEKILKKKMTQQQNVNVCTEMTRTILSPSTSTADVNGFMEDNRNLTDKMTDFSMKQEEFRDGLHSTLTSVALETSVNIPLSSNSSNISLPPLLSTQSISVDTIQHVSIAVSSVSQVSQDLISTTQSQLSAPHVSGQCYEMLQPVQCVQTMDEQQSENAAPLHPTYYYPPPSSQHTSCQYPSNKQCISLSMTPLSTTDRDIMLERYIQQQQQYYHQAQTQQNYPYPVAVKDTYNLKSPDSGFHEPCISPSDAPNLMYQDGQQSYGNETESSTAKIPKRRRSVPAMYAKQCWNSAEKTLLPVIPKLEVDPAGYKYFLESPISTTQRIDDDRITYLNKGQYYGLTLQFNGDRVLKNQTVKSIIMAVFRQDKHLEDEKKAWDFWHSRQHSFKQRVMDIDTKNSIGVLPSNVEEIAYNAVAVRWTPQDTPIVKMNVAIHCLSTDFSNQKGVKGLPLHIQIDTYENQKDSYPCSRAYCQIKVFCDKGAERKTRDEEKRKSNRAKGDGASSRKKGEEIYHPATERSEFYPMADLQTMPVLFTPSFERDNDSVQRTSPVQMTSNDEDGSSSVTSTGDQYDGSYEDGYFSGVKRPRQDSYCPLLNVPTVLLYTREQHETVFTALMLRIPTVQGLLQAIEEKYKVPASKIRNCYKRSKKGILVRMDDDIVRHYSHESTFMIELNCINENKDHEVIMTEIDFP